MKSSAKPSASRQGQGDFLEPGSGIDAAAACSAARMAGNPNCAGFENGLRFAGVTASYRPSRRGSGASSRVGS
ncbi:MAG: hypothetical protein QF732_04005, partial [Nitrospinaceae bacterium]|nr:hypothetical protein [Nitrospinaceae bacterium]